MCRPDAAVLERIGRLRLGGDLIHHLAPSSVDHVSLQRPPLRSGYFPRLRPDFLVATVLPSAFLDVFAVVAFCFRPLLQVFLSFSFVFPATADADEVV
jgi:hypothetical protein